MGASNVSMVIVSGSVPGPKRVTYVLIKVNVNASYSVKSCPRGLLCNHFRSQ